MAINLLRLARFVDGERPSAEKFNKLFSYIENKLSGLNSAIGDSINNGVTSIVDTNDQTFDIKINNIWGVSKFLAENVINSRTRYADIFSLIKSIGSMSNLNPLTLGGESIIKEVIPAGINEYVFKYPVLIQDPIKSSLTFLTDPVWLNQQTGFVEENGQMLEPGQWKLWKFFEIDGEDNTTISYAKSMVWYTTSTTPVEITYKTNSENWGGGANYQGSSFNVIPDFNTPKTALNSEDEDGFFYNLKFTNNNTTYTTVELPYVLYQQTALSRNELDTALLSEADINHKKRLTLPKYLKDYQLTLAQPTEFPLPKGFLTLVDFSEDTFTILDDLNYIYVDEHTFKVNISSSILNCVTADPNSSTYKQLFLLVNGTDITRSINDLQIKQNKHSHDGSFGESLIHIKDITGIFEKTDRNVYFPSARGGHIATQYLHRDGYRYNNDTQNYDNAMMGDLLISGNKGNSNKRSYKIYFKDYNSLVLGLDSSPGYFSLPGLNSNSWCWIGLSSIPNVTSNYNTLNIQGAEDGNVSILSNNNLVVASKDRIVSIIKEINNGDLSVDIIKNSFEWDNIQDEQSVQIQTDVLNGNINQTQISLKNKNNRIELLNIETASPTIEIISGNRQVSYNEVLDQFGKTVGLNSLKLISDENETKNELRLFTQYLSSSLFQKKEEYLSDKRQKSNKDFFKKKIPSYKKEYSETSPYNFDEQNGALENIKVIETNNSTQKKEGCFVYVIQHLVDDRNNPDFKFFMIPPQSEIVGSPSYLFPSDWQNILNPIIKKKHIYNATYDSLRTNAILNRESIYDTYTPIFGPGRYDNSYYGDLMYVDSISGYLMHKYTVNGNTTKETLKLLHTHSNVNYNFWSQTETLGDLVALRRFYKHNPFPSSKEYVNQHFYVYGYNSFRSTIHRMTSEIQGWATNLADNPVNEEEFISYSETYQKTRVLTKIIWKKFWLKENINSNSFDFEELLISGETRFNNDKYILVNQGYLIDCAIPPTLSDSVEDYDWNFDSDPTNQKKAAAKRNNYNRVCEFYEVNTDSNFYELYPNWIAGNKYNVDIQVDLNLDYNERAKTAIINGGLPFARHGNLQSENDYNDFFSYFKKHEFEDDNVILYFGKGFVNFHSLVGEGDYDDNLKYDIVRDERVDKILERSLNIKLKEKNTLDKNYKSKQNIKVVFSDFNGENLNLLNEILLKEGRDALPDCFIFDGEKGPASSVVQYLWKVSDGFNRWDPRGELNFAFKYSLDSKLYNSDFWIYGVLMNHSYFNSIASQNEMFNETPGASINLNNFGNSKIWEKHLIFKNSISYNYINWSLQEMDGTEFYSDTKPRTFFTFLNIVFDKEEKDDSYFRKLNNQINLKSNGSSNSFLNCKNLTINLKNISDSAKPYNIGPIQGFYNIEIDRFTNNEKSYWSIADKLLLNEKFGCSLFDIKVNTDMSFCFIC